jgi:hypothetical protein
VVDRCGGEGDWNKQCCSARAAALQWAAALLSSAGNDGLTVGCDADAEQCQAQGVLASKGKAAGGGRREERIRWDC